ncbi:MAG TPA: type II 3-dehydroquinate dehydratase, partial [Clostridiales bacterium]|nr:type II 3-dehydroquinate dehydratase [Clostridiales bacterium]
LVIHGPNLNLLGEREPGVYGNQSFESVNKTIIDSAEKMNAECEIFQSNHEGEIIDKLHAARLGFDGIVINAGAYTHYSYAIRDAISAVKIPCIEVHISNVFAREEFRANSVIAPVCLGSICGFGVESYILAMQVLSNR